jgi:GNAT superfamily N-acetyltransferase
VSQRLQEYMLASAARGREVVRAGPFTATITGHDAGVYVNYAIPDPGAEPTPADIAALVEAFTSRTRTPRLEYLPGLAPAVEPALLAAGFVVTERLPLMECPPGAEIDRPVPDGIELLTPGTDEELTAFLAAQHEAFGEPPPTAEHLAAARDKSADGHLRLLARDVTSGEPAGGGVAVAVRDGISEIAGIGVRPKHQRRGVGAALTLHLTRAAHAAGAGLAFLTAAGDPQERTYARVGYRRTDSVLFLTRPESTGPESTGPESTGPESTGPESTDKESAKAEPTTEGGASA